MNDQISNKVFFLQALLCAIELEHSLENWPPDIQELKTSVRVDVRSEERQFTFVLPRKVFFDVRSLAELAQKMPHKCSLTRTELTFYYLEVGTLMTAFCIVINHRIYNRVNAL